MSARRRVARLIALTLGMYCVTAGMACAQTNGAAAGTIAPVDAVPTPGDADLDRIPPAVGGDALSATSPPAGDASRSVYLENAVNLNAYRGNLLVPPPPSVNDPWEEHLFADVRKTWRLNPAVLFTLSGRANVQAQNDIPFPEQQNFRLDFREGYFSLAPTNETYIDVGRINLKSGVAIGSNPTDFFKTRAVVDPTSQDPTVLRNDRLGTLMTRVQQVWNGGAVTFAYAPKVQNQKPISADETLPSLDPMFDRTNSSNRFLLKGNMNLSENFSPEGLIYYADRRAQFGLNLTASLGQSIVGYLEWSGGVRSDLAHDALSFGRQTGELPAAAALPFTDDEEQRFRHDLVAGFSYTTASQVVINLEYHYFQAGFSAGDWRTWFRVGESGGSAIRSELWFIRQYAADQQSPISQQSLFLRFDRTDAFIRNLELQGFVSDDLLDGSASVQIEADYYLSNRWTLGTLVNGAIGTRRSDFGSVPLELLVQFKIARYF